MSKETPKTEPKRPPLVPLSDLSIYTSPHCEYNNYFEDNSKCPEYNDLLIFQYLLPIVKMKRIAISKIVTEKFEEVTQFRDDALKFVYDKTDEFINKVRHPDNLVIRKGIVATSGAIGFFAGRRMGTFKDSVVKGILASAFATLATGWLCFPKETDEHFRKLCYQGVKILINVHNFYANGNYQLKQRLPCASELPEKPKPNQNIKCPKNIECSYIR